MNFRRFNKVVKGVLYWGLMNLILQDYSHTYSLPTLLLNSLSCSLLPCCIKFDSAGNILAAGTIVGDIVVWDMDTLMVSYKLRGHASSVSALSFSNDSKYLLSSSHDWNLILWDLYTLDILYKIPFDSPMLSASIHPTDPFKFLAIGEFAWHISVRDQEVFKSKLFYPEMSNTDLPCCIKYDLDGSKIYISTTKGEFIILSQDLNLISRIKVASKSIVGFTFSSQETKNEIIVNSSDGIVRLFEIEENSLIYKTKFVESVEKIRWIDIGFSNLNDYIISGSSANNAHNIYIWEKGKGTLLKKLEGPKEGLSDVKWHPKRPLIASLSSLGRIFLWSVNYVQNFSAFAPSFTETDDNVEYIEKEDEFDVKEELVTVSYGVNDLLKSVDVYETPDSKKLKDLVRIEGSSKIEFCMTPRNSRNCASESVLQHNYKGVVYYPGDAVLLRGDKIGIIYNIQTTKLRVTALVHEFTDQETLSRMEFRGKKLTNDLAENELLYNTGTARQVSFKEFVEKVELSNEDSSQYFCTRAIDIDRGRIFDVSWDLVEKGQDLIVDSPIKISPKSSRPKRKPVVTDDETMVDSVDGEGHDKDDMHKDSEEEVQQEVSGSDHEHEVSGSDHEVEKDDLILPSDEDASEEMVSVATSEESPSVQEVSSDEDDSSYKKAKLQNSKSRRKRIDRIRHSAKPIIKKSSKFNMNDIMVTRKLPKNATVYQKARDRLYLSYTPDSLPCREKEFDEIYMFLEELIEARSGACIYISGVPGTGKTATVYSVMNAFQKQMQEKKIPHCELIEINGMKLTDPSQAYQLLWEGLTGKKVSSSHALELLTKRFASSSSNEAPCIVLMDELDLLLTKNQKVIYNFFDWPNKPNSRLIVLAIANTMDLPERTLSNKVASRLEMKRITFQPYTFPQLVQIVESRLATFNIFTEDAIMLCARKVSSISGDARRALAICRRAIELLEESSLTLKNQTITLNHIQKVITDMYAGPGTQAVRKASLHQKIFLVSIFRVARVNGKQEVEFGDVCTEHERICGLKGMYKPTNRDLVAVASFMSSFHLIHCETNKMGDPYQKMRLLVSEDDLVMALKEDDQNEFLVKIIET